MNLVLFHVEHFLLVNFGALPRTLEQKTDSKGCDSHLLVGSRAATSAIGMIEYHGFFAGHVQGVGFRFVCRDVAARHAVSGWVKNKTDGRVELSIQGSATQVESFLQELRSQMGKLIQRETGSYEKDTLPLRGFEIRHE